MKKSIILLVVGILITIAPDALEITNADKVIIDITILQFTKANFLVFLGFIVMSVAWIMIIRDKSIKDRMLFLYSMIAIFSGVGYVIYQYVTTADLAIQGIVWILVGIYLYPNKKKASQKTS